MINRNVRYTYRDYLQLPESEEKRYELIDGELYMVPSPTSGTARSSGPDPSSSGFGNTG